MELVEFGELTEQRRLELEGEEADPFEVASSFSSADRIEPGSTNG